MFKSIRWRIASSYVALIVLATFLLSVYLLQFVRDNYLRNLESRLIAEARLVSIDSEQYFSARGTAEELDTLAKRLGGETGARVTIVDLDGVVQGDSIENPAMMENHGARPEIRQALASGVGESSRHSSTVGYDMMYVAVPIKVGEKVVGVARVALAVTEIDRSLGHIARTIAAAAGAAAFLAILVAMYLARVTTEPVKRLERMAAALASGNLDQRIRIDSPVELGELANAFNRMAERLKATISAISEEHGKLAAIMANMADGIVITDGDGKVTLLNRAAESILGTSNERAQGQSLAEAVRDHDLVQLLTECRIQAKAQPCVRLFQLQASKRYVKGVATAVRDSNSAQYLVVLQDLTEVRRAESVRREFVGNVSHELRTPLASMRALVETLQDGAMDDPPAAKDFLRKMEIEVDEMTQMVRELLELSRIESGQVDFKMEPTDFGPLVRQTVERMKAQAERAGIELATEVTGDLPIVVADGERIRQVLVNLIHNAIKFTPPPGKIIVSVLPATEPQVSGVAVSVADTGVGIPADDLARIFERFYKADKSRSSGGTGLGLAIAKHIVQAHGGNIWVESRVPAGRGGGSTFHFSLPLTSV
ncbi:MAG: HAMP domain-containing protein [Chloroflexi bacterium]|nr:HAMP domain-containing protein [Chloroflexota bacterium]